MQTKVKDLMKADPVIIATDATLKEAAQKMKSVDCGALPVGSSNNLEGMITDRDIVVRAVAAGIDTASAQVGEFMTTDVFFCDENDTLEKAAQTMNEHHVARLAVKDSSGKVRGILTFGCILRNHRDKEEISKIVESAVGKKAA